MRFIDIEGKTPVNTPANPDFPQWQPWTQEAWQVWLDKSNEFKQELEHLHQAGDVEGRNKFIDDHESHWGDLKEWLTVLSFGKCWFSEAKEIFSHYDVEHFRPKKAAKELDGTKRDGYWWLAFDYTNFRLCGNVGNRKKGTWFPLSSESCLSSFDNPREESEEPYLLDPTDEEDVNLIAFDDEGKAIPSPGCSEWEKQRVCETITRLKLNDHINLAEERRKVWQKVSQEIDAYCTAKARCAMPGNPGARERAKNHGRNIKNYAKDSEELSTVAKYCVLFRNDPQLARLVSSNG